LLNDLAAAGDTCSEMGKAARERVVNRFCWDSILFDMVKPEGMDIPRQPRQRQKSSIKRLLKLASGMLVH
jgi:hypothetical protein